MELCLFRKKHKCSFYKLPKHNDQTEKHVNKHSCEGTSRLLCEKPLKGMEFLCQKELNYRTFGKSATKTAIDFLFPLGH